MFTLFTPQTKVQKNRQIIRDTDMRMAKYSRRGVITNFLIYVLCLSLEGTFIEQHQTTATVLTSGLFLVTLVRGYFLFRIQVIYPRGPSAWRTKYFLATLAGATWWGLILAYITLYTDLQGEASLMWLYTVIFFSTTAHAFAPYQRFLSIYQFIGLVPASCCTFLVGGYIGPFYGFLLLSFYVLLNYHCSLMSQNYWERLEAQYTLVQKSVSLEEEKRDTRASVKLTNQYIQLLSEKLFGILNQPEKTEKQEDSDSAVNPLTLLHQNVDDFKKVLTKEITVSESVFNVRHLLQYLVQSTVDNMELNELELETTLSPALPSRMLGDPYLIQRIITILLNSVFKSGHHCTLFMSVDFIREYERSGELLVTISRQKDVKKNLFHSEEHLVLPLGLDLILAKGLAETLEGSLKIDETGAVDGKYLRLRCPLKVAEPGARPEYHRLAYKGRPILLIHWNNHWLNLKCLELESMGFDVTRVEDFKVALQTLKEAVVLGKVFQCVVFTALPDSNACVQFSHDVLESNELKYIHQLVICSKNGKNFFSKALAVESPQIHYISKPAGCFEFEFSFSTIFEGADLHYLKVSEGDQEPLERRDLLWVSFNKVFDRASVYESETIHIVFASEFKQIVKALEENTIQMIIIEYTDAASIECAASIREEEIRLGREELIPIVAVGPVGEAENLLRSGADHFIDDESLSSSTLPSLAFWLKGGHH